MWKNGSLATLGSNLKNKYTSELLHPRTSVTYQIPVNTTSVLFVSGGSNKGSLYLLSTTYNMLSVAKIIDNAGSDFSLTPDESYTKFKITNTASVAITCGVLSYKVTIVG